MSSRVYRMRYRGDSGTLFHCGNATIDPDRRIVWEDDTSDIVVLDVDELEIIRDQPGIPPLEFFEPEPGPGNEVSAGDPAIARTRIVGTTHPSAQERTAASQTTQRVLYRHAECLLLEPSQAFGACMPVLRPCTTVRRRTSASKNSIETSVSLLSLPCGQLAEGARRGAGARRVRNLRFRRRPDGRAPSWRS